MANPQIGFEKKVTPKKLCGRTFKGLKIKNIKTVGPCIQLWPKSKQNSCNKL